MAVKTYDMHLSTKGFGDRGLWHPDCDVWGKGCVRTDKTVRRESL